MKQYIDKDALVAEIEKRRSKNARNKLNIAAAFEDNYLLSFINTLEVKEEVTTDAFIDKACEWLSKNTPDYINAFIEHDFGEFVEDFRKAQKGE